jgi:hypothetical protein
MCAEYEWRSEDNFQALLLCFLCRSLKAFTSSTIPPVLGFALETITVVLVQSLFFQSFSCSCHNFILSFPPFPQDKNQKPTHLAGAFLAFILGNLYFWLQFFLSWWVKGLPQPGPHWIKSLRLSLCSLSTILIVASILSRGEDWSKMASLLACSLCCVPQWVSLHVSGP